MLYNNLKEHESYFKYEYKIYTRILNKIHKSLNIFTFDTSEEKDLLIELLSQKINSLKSTIEYIDYWNNNQHINFTNDGKDIRL